MLPAQRDPADVVQIHGVDLAWLLGMAILTEHQTPDERRAIKVAGRLLYGENWKPPPPGQGMMM